MKTCVLSLESPVRGSHWIPFSFTQSSSAWAYGVCEEVLQGSFMPSAFADTESRQERRFSIILVYSAVFLNLVIRMLFNLYLHGPQEILRLNILKR